MRTFLMALMVFSCWSIFARYYYVCKIKQNCTSIRSSHSEDRLKTLSLRYNNTDKLKGYDQFFIKKGKINPTLNESNKDFLDKIAVYLGNHPKQNLTITGYMRPAEKGLAAPKTSFQENIGSARAEYIEKLLVAKDVDESRITLDYQYSDDVDLKAPLGFELFDAEGPKEYEKLQFNFHDMTFSDANFEYNSATFNPGEKFLLYADSVKTYFELNRDKTLTITGHTDNDGSNSYNDNLGLKRSENAKKFFIELGIAADIVVASRGEREPVAPNDIEKNKQRNRRVNFKLE